MMMRTNYNLKEISTHIINLLKGPMKAPIAKAELNIAEAMSLITSSWKSGKYLSRESIMSGRTGTKTKAFPIPRIACPTKTTQIYSWTPISFVSGPVRTIPRQFKTPPISSRIL